MRRKWDSRSQSNVGDPDGVHEVCRACQGLLRGWVAEELPIAIASTALRSGIGDWRLGRTPACRAENCCVVPGLQCRAAALSRLQLSGRSRALSAGSSLVSSVATSERAAADEQVGCSGRASDRQCLCISWLSVDNLTAQTEGNRSTGSMHGCDSGANWCTQEIRCGCFDHADGGKMQLALGIC
jgi:hypothetical protein